MKPLAAVTPIDPHAAAIAASHDLHRRELAERDWQILRLRMLLAKHGIDIPDDDDPATAWSAIEHWEDCKVIVALAYDMAEALDGFRARMGTAKELLSTRPFR